MKKDVHNNSESGYIAISIMLILTAVVLGVIVTVAQLGIGEGQVSLALSRGEDTLHFVEGCTEDALLKIRSNPSYAPGTINRPEGTCAIDFLHTPGDPNWNIEVSTLETTYERKMRVIFVRNATGITLTSWKEF